jgi:hypothetical protein
VDHGEDRLLGVGIDDHALTLAPQRRIDPPVPNPFSATRRLLGFFTSAVVLLAVQGLAGTPLDLVGRYSGTYLVDGTTSVQTLQLEVERQHGRRIHVSVFAMNEPEYMGRGHLSADNTRVNLATHATGRRRLVLHAGVLDGGATLDGTFTSKQPGRPAVTGTFTVAR